MGEKLCECGCGQPAPIAKANYPSKGHVKGQPVRFINGHNARGVPKSAEMKAKLSKTKTGVPVPALRGPRPGAWKTATRISAHNFLNLHYPKTGICAQCGREGKTDYAFLHHPAPYTRNRDDYAELCRSCHVFKDFADGIRPMTVSPVIQRQPSQRALKTHCKRGHEFTPENTRWYRGFRHCRACARLRTQLRRALS